MRICIDTNRYRDFCDNEPDVVKIFQKAEWIILPFITLAELRAGFQCGTLAKKNEGVLTKFLNSSRVEISYANEDTTHHYARLFRQLREQGTPIPVNDIWIAALVVQHDLLLYSRDKHFDVIPQLSRIIDKGTPFRRNVTTNSCRT
ncbi:MAG: type II toxin-antitoxin system VapC family toxin [Spartobacteria bacterium]|nr:type II toxin-antitoxin system VapC family toxin [Spartobacteria bacterium]